MLNLKRSPLYTEDLRKILELRGIESVHGKIFLITGATGLLGVHLIDALMLFDGVRVIAVGRNKQKASERLGEYFDNPRFTFLEQDVCEPFPADIVADYIIPLASNTHPLAYSKYPVETMLTNLKGAEHALNLAERCGAMVLYPSSVEIYGNLKEPVSENETGQLNLSNARSCYPESKRACEALCQSYLAERNVKVKIVRLCRVFGPTMLDSDSKASSQFIKKALAGEDIVLKSKGEQFYSYIYVTDAVRAMLFVLIFGEVGEAYNISSDNCNVKLLEFAQQCSSLYGRRIQYDMPSGIEKKGYSIADSAVLKNHKLSSIGFVPLYSFSEAIRRTLTIRRK